MDVHYRTEITFTEEELWHINSTVDILETLITDSCSCPDVKDIASDVVDLVLKIITNYCDTSTQQMYGDVPKLTQSILNSIILRETK